MRRSIGQPVARHDPVKTAAADPVVDVPVLLFRVDKFDARSRRHDESVGRLGDVAAMVEPVRVEVRRELNFDFTGEDVSTGERARVLAAGRRS